MRNSPRPEATTGGLYLVVVQDRLVLQDLCEAIRDFVPGARVVDCAGLSDALAVVSGRTDIVLAFVEAGPAEIRRSGFGRAIRAGGGKLVLLGEDAEQEWEGGARTRKGWQLLLRPFDSGSIACRIASARC